MEAILWTTFLGPSWRSTVNSDGPFISIDKKICLSEHIGDVKEDVFVKMIM